MDRRRFLKLAAGSSATALACQTQARPNHEPSDEAIGMLYDSTLCVGCQACVYKCQEVNNLPVNPENDAFTINNKLSIHTNNVIQVWESGEANQKDQQENGYAYIKRQCMHCVDPDCVSACPVSAMTKDPKTGIVHHHPEYCVACRYCMVACPYNVPQFELNDIYGKLRKCEFCNQKGVERLDNGLLPGCVEVCPTGAVIYGTRSELLEEAKKRLSTPAGSEYEYARLTLDSNDYHKAKTPNYEQYIFGEDDGGGTQSLVISGVPYENLDLPKLSKRAVGARTETMNHLIYSGMVLPAMLFGGFLLRTRGNMLKHEKEKIEKEASNGKTDAEDKNKNGGDS